MERERGRVKSEGIKVFSFAVYFINVTQHDTHCNEYSTKNKPKKSVRASGWFTNDSPAPPCVHTKSLQLSIKKRLKKQKNSK